MMSDAVQIIETRADISTVIKVVVSQEIKIFEEVFYSLQDVSKENLMAVNLMEAPSRWKCKQCNWKEPMDTSTWNEMSEHYMDNHPEIVSMIMMALI